MVVKARLSASGQFLPPASGGTLTPLSSVLFVDGGNTASGTPDGSIANPFLTIQAAIDASAALLQVTIYVAPGTYAEAPIISEPAQVVNLVGMTSDLGFFGTEDPTPLEHDPVTITGLITGSGAPLGLAELTCLAVLNNAGDVQLRNVRLTNNGVNCTCANVDAWTNRSGWRLRASVDTGTITSDGYDLAQFNANNVVCNRSKVTGLSGSTLGTGDASRFTLTDFAGAGITIDPAAGIEFDLYSYERVVVANSGGGVVLPTGVKVIGTGALQNLAFDSTASPVDQTLLPAGHAPGLYDVGFALGVATAGAHTLTPTVVGSGEGGAFAIGNNPAWTAVDTSATKTVGFAPVCVFSDGTAPLILRWTWDSTAGDIADVVSDASALPQGS